MAQRKTVDRHPFKVDVSKILEALDYMDKIPKKIIDSIADEIVTLAREVAESVFVSVINSVSEEAFPIEFKHHVLDVVANVPIKKQVRSTSISVEFDFNQLGTRADLQRAFHQGAKLADGSTLDGPYTGQELKEKNPAIRHIYWEAVHKGATFAPNPKGPGHIPVPPGAWEETKRKYIQIWGDKAPEWLYLQFGQRAWEPNIPESTIIEDFVATFFSTASELVFQRVSEEIEIAQSKTIRREVYGTREVFRDIKSGRFTFSPRKKRR